jgi:tetratricopeptide (TPR) repeat protein
MAPDAFSLHYAEDHGIKSRPIMKRIALFGLVGCLVVGFGRSALADRALAKSGNEKAGNERVAKEKAAKKACATGDYQKGVDILADLLVDTNDTVYIYNQGRCYQQSNRWEQAISRFREYLRKAKHLSEGDRADTQRQIDECQESMNQANAMLPPPMPTAPPPPVVAPVPAPEPPQVQSKPVAPPDDSRGKGLRVAGIIAASVGVAAIGTGIGLALKANSLETSTYSKSREDDRSSLKTWSLVSYGVGGAAIATGAILYIIGWPNQSSSNVAFIPALGPAGASLSFRGKF